MPFTRCAFFTLEDRRPGLRDCGGWNRRSPRERCVAASERFVLPRRTEATRFRACPSRNQRAGRETTREQADLAYG